MTAPVPTFLRSMTTVHTLNLRLVQTEAFWRELLPTLTFLPHRTETGEFTERMQAVVERLNPELRTRVLSGQLFLFEDVDRPSPNECLISIHPEANEVSFRIFGRYLTDIQSTSEWFLRRLLDAQEQFVITPHTRCFVLLDVHGERTDLTTGRVLPLRHRLWQGFYREHIYSVNITATVVVLTLGVVLLLSPDAPHSALGKFYGVCERILSAAIMNVFLLMGQFYSYRQGRRVVEWEKP
ncbi:hypothetical protein [Deinococcus aluminii]|uniref:Uncharacterized protein n=1 Tax=Deinococcus aluminii TaxID=1656885 RepID=A0ABP9XA23_9DEIO